jgi:acetoacetate decarboxylase
MPGCYADTGTTQIPPQDYPACRWLTSYMRAGDYHRDLVFKGGWTGPAALALSSHALAPVADLPVREVISCVPLIADLTLDLGEVVHNYLA